MAESPGTTKKETFQNQILRQEIMSKKDVIQLLQTYTLPEGFVHGTGPASGNEGYQNCYE